MKIWKLISLLLLAAFVGACDDDKVSDDETGGNGGGSVANVEVRFGYEAKTVLKNAGQVLVPVKLAQVVSNAVKVTVDAEKGDEPTDAREGIDFNIAEKVVTIPAGDTVAYVNVDLLDNGKADNNRVLKLNITGVYGGKVGTPKSASLHIVSNAFVEFEKTKWETYESANVETSSEEIRNSRFVPLMITGDLTEAATVVFEVTDSTAVEPTHFTVEKELTVTPGTTKVNVEIKPVDDNVVNEDRIFILKIKEIKGGNLLVGKTSQNCEVKIISEEVQRVLSWGITSLERSDEEEVLNIPISLDKVPGDDLKIKVVAVAPTDAVEGVDYEIITKEVTIDNSRQAIVQVKILGDKEVNANRSLVLAFTEITDNTVFVNEKAKSFMLSIKNDDFPAFDAEVMDVEEDNNNSITIHLPAVNRDRVITLRYNSSETTLGEYFDTSLTTLPLPANATEVTLPVKVKYTNDFPSVVPILTVQVIKVDNFTLAEAVQADLKLAPCAYRKLLGDWIMNADNPDNCTSPTDATITQVTWQKEVKVVMSSFWNSQNVYFNMTYDKVTQELRMVLNKRCEDHNWNFGAPNTNVGLRLLVDGALNLTDIAMGGYDVENGIITLPIDKHIGGGGSQGNLTDKPAVWGFFWKNGTLNKK